MAGNGVKGEGYITSVKQNCDASSKYLSQTILLEYGTILHPFKYVEGHRYRTICCRHIIQVALFVSCLGLVKRWG